MDRLKEYIHVVRLLLTNEHTDLDGAYYQLSKARCEPKGLQGRPSTVITGEAKSEHSESPRAMRITEN